MARLKIENKKHRVKPTNIKSSNVSSSLSSNMNLIQSQINLKTNDYINIKNAAKILESYSNWNGYIMLYTEVENNFNVGDIAYITLTEPTYVYETDYNIENPSVPFNDFYTGYKILYTDKYKNAVVINRYYNDIPSGKKLKNQYLSKISCRGGDFYDKISDGVVFYDCNILNSDFATITGVVSGSTISGATIICAGLSTKSDENGIYTLNVPTGTNTVKCKADGYITKTFTINISKNRQQTQNIIMTPGSNALTITSTPAIPDICSDGWVYFASNQIGYDSPVSYQWKITRNLNVMNVGTNNSTFSYNSFNNLDIVTCEVTDDFGTTICDNPITIYIIPKTIVIGCSANPIYPGQLVSFSAFTNCYQNPTYQWRLNGININGETGYTYSTNTLINNDVVTCVIGVNISNTITMLVTLTSTTTAIPVTTTTTT